MLSSFPCHLLTLMNIFSPLIWRQFDDNYTWRRFHAFTLNSQVLLLEEFNNFVAKLSIPSEDFLNSAIIQNIESHAGLQLILTQYWPHKRKTVIVCQTMIFDLLALTYLHWIGNETYRMEWMWLTSRNIQEYITTVKICLNNSSLEWLQSL